MILLISMFPLSWMDLFWSDNGNSFVIGKVIHQHQKLVDASKEILKKAIDNIKSGVKKRGYKVIKNLGGHGIVRSLHEQPEELLNYRNRFDQRRFKKNSVVAIETFITTSSAYAVELNDCWTMVGDQGGFMAQHEHTILITDGKPIILTEMNGV